MSGGGGGAEANQLLAFIKIEITDQLDELLQYLRSHGADSLPEQLSGDLHADLSHVISACHTCFTSEVAAADVEAVLNSIVSLVMLDTIPDHEKLVVQFCEKLAAMTTYQETCLKVTRLLFSSLKPDSAIKFDVYYCMVSLAGKVDQIDSVFTSIADMEESLGSDLPVANKQKLLRLVYRELLTNKHSEPAALVMIELLRTYSERTAREAQEEARSCILAALSDPDTYLVDHLLSLPPVQALQDTPLHQLLTIFVSGGLTEYRQFLQQHGSLIAEWGLNADQLQLKMQQLTFMQLAQRQPVMPFELVHSQLEIPEERIEQFIIDMLRTRLVRGRMDQLQRKVHVSSTAHRTFGRAQWQQLRDVLATWRQNVAQTRASMQMVVAAQMEAATQPGGGGAGGGGAAATAGTVAAHS